MNFYDLFWTSDNFDIFFELWETSTFNFELRGTSMSDFELRWPPWTSMDFGELRLISVNSDQILHSELQWTSAEVPELRLRVYNFSGAYFPLHVACRREEAGGDGGGEGAQPAALCLFGGDGWPGGQPERILHTPSPSTTHTWCQNKAIPKNIVWWWRVFSSFIRWTLLLKNLGKYLHKDGIGIPKST